MTTRPPVVKPAKTGFKPQRFYTIHSHPNHVFTLKPHAERRFSILGFKEIDDALLVGRMLQAYQLRQKDLPTPEPEGTLTLVNAPEDQDILTLSIREWDFQDLQFYCTRYIFDMISVDKIRKNKTNYSFDGDLYTFEAPPEFYQEAFEVLFNSNPS